MPSFYRFRDITFSWSKICVFRRFTDPSFVWSPTVKTAWSYRHWFWVNTSVWSTDRRTDGHAVWLGETKTV